MARASSKRNDARARHEATPPRASCADHATPNAAAIGARPPGDSDRLDQPAPRASACNGACLYRPRAYDQRHGLLELAQRHRGLKAARAKRETPRGEFTLRCDE